MRMRLLVLYAETSKLWLGRTRERWKERENKGGMKSLCCFIVEKCINAIFIW